MSAFQSAFLNHSDYPVERVRLTKEEFEQLKNEQALLTDAYITQQSRKWGGIWVGSVALISAMAMPFLFSVSVPFGLLGTAGAGLLAWRSGRKISNGVREVLVEKRETVLQNLETRSRPQRSSVLPDLSDAQWRGRLGIKMPGLV